MISVGSEVQILPGPPNPGGGVAQLGEHLLCKQGVIGSNPFTSIPCSRAMCFRVRASSQRRNKFGPGVDHLRLEGFAAWLMVRGLPRRDGASSVLWNCESGSGASLGAPLVGDPCERVPTVQVSAQAGAGRSRSLTGQGPAGWQHLVGYSLAIDGTCDQRRFANCRL